MRASLQLPATSSDFSYTPEFYRINTENDIHLFNEFLAQNSNIFVFDTIHSQLCELIKSLHPSRKLNKEELTNAVEKHLNGVQSQHYGVWVYYPWARRLVHLLDEEEFVEVRTNRNQYKITREERAILATKKIGIVGLSVGQSIALSLAMERGFGELRLADFDDLELSNLNRIRTPLHTMGLKKVTVVAREIAELDPFLKVTLFDDGLTEDNIERFFTGGGKLDLLVDECDGLDMKVTMRHYAKQKQIPVIMDTSDRGMLDVERFDLEPDRPLLHGLMGDVNPADIKGLTNEQKIPYILPMIGGENISARMKASMMEVEESINTWPQLATSVILGGAVSADVSRRILLNQFHDSGRYYIDLEELVANKTPYKYPEIIEKPAPLSKQDIQNELTGLTINGDDAPAKEEIDAIVTAACLAPTGGNSQPWKWVYHNKALLLFHDEHYSFSFLDYKKYGSYVGFGAAFENVDLKAAQLGYTTAVQLFPKGNSSPLVAIVTFSKNNSAPKDELANFIETRLTNRNTGHYEPISENEIEKIQASISKIKYASLKFITDRNEINKLATIIAGADKIRMMHPQGHRDTFFSEMRWTPEEAESTRDGIDIATVGVSAGEAAGFAMAKDYKAIDYLREWGKGEAFEKLTKKGAAIASAIVLVKMPGATIVDYIEGSKAMQRVWLETTRLGYAVQPVSVPLFMFRRLTEGGGEGLSTTDMDKLQTLKQEYGLILAGYESEGHIFMLKLSKADEPKVKALRRKLEDVLFYI